MLGNFSFYLPETGCQKEGTATEFLTATGIFYVLNSFQLTQKRFSKFF